MSASPTLRQLLESHERAIILAALGRCGGSRAQAARSLGIRRAYLHERVRKLGIDLTHLPRLGGRRTERAAQGEIARPRERDLGNRKMEKR